MHALDPGGYQPHTVWCNSTTCDSRTQHEWLIRLSGTPAGRLCHALTGVNPALLVLVQGEAMSISVCAQLKSPPTTTGLPLASSALVCGGGGGPVGECGRGRWERWWRLLGGGDMGQGQGGGRHSGGGHEV